jgi:hypothetical protein
MLKIISNLVDSNDNDYCEHEDFERKINDFLFKNPDYQLNKIFNVDNELIAILNSTKKTYEVATVVNPKARYNFIDEIMELCKKYKEVE